MNDMKLQDIEDTLGKLGQVIETTEKRAAIKFANSAKETVEGIKENVEAYNGSVTDNQARAVNNIDNAAQNILDGE